MFWIVFFGKRSYISENASSEEWKRLAMVYVCKFVKGKKWSKFWKMLDERFIAKYTLLFVEKRRITEPSAIQKRKDLLAQPKVLQEEKKTTNLHMEWKLFGEPPSRPWSQQHFKNVLFVYLKSSYGSFFNYFKYWTIKSHF